jgi:hypothetical protein
MKALAAAILSAMLNFAAQAETLTFHAKLTGEALSSKTGSKATGQATLSVDTMRQTVSLDLDVTGITLDGLWDQVVAAPIGPIHLHHYSQPDHSNAAGVTLVMPVPFGPAYKAKKGGFRVTTTNYPYADGAALVESKMPFDQFVASLEGGDVVLNIHTDKFNDGEISGVIEPAEQH